jgi:hypothetical protein
MNRVAPVAMTSDAEIATAQREARAWITPP